MIKKPKKCPRCKDLILKPAFWKGEEICQACWFREKNRERHIRGRKTFLDKFI